MGLKYKLTCYQCHEGSEWIEFSIIPDAYHVKHIPDDLQTLENNWIPFLFKHIDHHKLDLIDTRGQRTDPTKLTGANVLGIVKSPLRERS